MSECGMEPIAIIGMSCRFPGGANSPSKLWELLSSPRDVRSQIPKDRFNSEGFYDKRGERFGSTNVDAGYFLESNIRNFDAAFFNINPKEAEAIDPQQRNLLELVYEATESAGLTLDGLRGSSTSVYTGMMSNDYHEIQMRDPDTMPKYTATGTARSIVSNRISYFFDWKGPSMTIDTACSSSLIAVHQAVQTLRCGDSNLAVAIGTNLILGPELYINASSLHMLSPTARSRMWDADADGYVRGEGFAVVILKRLSDAIRDGDHIESIVRATGTNQDGRTRGITMPSAESQCQLIRSTYLKSGLNPRNANDRPQFFEAHGTGTPAGDPIEAEAIYSAFFEEIAEDTANSQHATINGRNQPNKNSSRAEVFPKINGKSEDGKSGEPFLNTSSSPLYVGSIKTIIGHLEGCAGLAGLLKSSLAVKHAIIPPNMLFNRLNESIAPFYANLEVPTTQLPWPSLPKGIPRRISTNSFGFGGSNCHCVLESFDTSKNRQSGVQQTPSCLPFVFSANSEKSLRSNLEALVEYLDLGEIVNERDLAWTLYARRTCFPIRSSVSVSPEFPLSGQIRLLLDQNDFGRATKQINGGPIILGVFTGQGAQWPSMGRELLLRNHVFRETIRRLEESLAGIPESPEWTISDELLADPTSTRIHEALLSQPLCTAIQIGLVNLLRHAGINFSAVVGHSSGEIAAAYAAGLLLERDAIRISYYRGFYAKLSCGFNGETGGMLAIGISMAQANELIASSRIFPDRIVVAASNGPESVTLSGDESAVNEMKALMDSKGIFCRKLKVDTAYHSHHMQACMNEYREALRGACIVIQTPIRQCKWYSSVDLDRWDLPGRGEALQEDYWVQNMIKPVLFSQAVESTLSDNSIDDLHMTIEVGPHPALKGPFESTQKAIGKHDVPYVGLLKRNSNAGISFSAALGIFWEHFGSNHVDFQGYEQACEGAKYKTHKLITGLPSYAWDHTESYWKESRQSKLFRLRSVPRHDLLGLLTHESIGEELRWCNVLRVEDLPWLQSHRVQNQILLPAAAFLVMVVEACREVSKDYDVKAFELENIVLSKAIVFGSDTDEVEINLSFHNIKRTVEGKIISVSFTCYSSSAGSTERWSKNACGEVSFITDDDGTETILPETVPFEFRMPSIDSKLFYESLDVVGLNYSNEFRQLESLNRRLNNAKAKIMTAGFKSSMLVHPAILDMMFQTLFVAFCFPNDGRLDTPYVPTSIRRLTLSNIEQNWHESQALEIQTALHPSMEGVICADINAVGSHNDQTLLQLESLTLTAIKSKASGYRELFCKTVREPDITAGIVGIPGQDHTADELELVTLCERLSLAYLRQFMDARGNKSIPSKWHHKCLIEYCKRLFTRVELGLHSTIDKLWACDDLNQLLQMAGKYPDQIDLQMIQAVGHNLSFVVRGEIEMLEVMMENDMLNRYYKDGLGFGYANQNLGEIAARLAHRYPSMNILEVGAGTGGATRSVLKQLKGVFSTYVFTDVSTGFFERASIQFSEYKDQMRFVALDVEKNILSQGFQEHSYDLIIASNVLHATQNLEATMRNVRRLLRPGGYILMLEVTSEILRVKLMMSGLPGWWLGHEDGRRDGPTVSEGEWDTILKACGYSGVDVAIKDFNDPSKYMTSIILSQAVNDTVEYLRAPLTEPLDSQVLENILIVGGTAQDNEGPDNNIQSLISTKMGPPNIIRTVHRFEETLGFSHIPSLILCLIDLDNPFFHEINDADFRGLQKVFDSAQYVLWVTRDCTSGNPWANMSVGLLRSLQSELPHVQFQMLDIDSLDYDPRDISNLILSTFSRLVSPRLRSVSQENLLWTIESELSYRQGSLWIPRILPNSLLNDQLKSPTGYITEESIISECTLEIFTNSNVVQLRKKTEVGCGENQVKIHVTHSTMQILTLGDKVQVSICLGNVIEVGVKVKRFPHNSQAIGLSAMNGSKVFLEADHEVWPCSVPIGTENAFLQVLTECVRLRSLAASLPAQGTLVLLDPSASIAEQVHRLSTLKIISLASKRHKDDTPLFVHPRTSELAISKILPNDVVAVIDCAITTRNGLRSRITSSLRLKQREDVRSCHFHEYSNTTTAQFGEAVKHVSSQPVHMSYQPEALIQVKDLQGRDLNSDESLVIDWSGSQVVPALILPIDPTELFKTDRTYFLVGFTGGLGQSLCRWMVSNGARNLALTTRNPEAVDEVWLQELRKCGAIVKLYKMNVGNSIEVLAVRDRVKQEMPPIIGVANAAMVLVDKAFNQMSYTDLSLVLDPKVQGSQNLDTAFSEDTLDFFVLFSSLACVVGNRGQSNYSAANMFMTSLAAQRRKRGLAASVIDIGMVLGVGYIAQTGLYEAGLRKFNYIPICEPDMHTIFFQAIVAGQQKTDSWEDCELITGLSRIQVAAEDDNKVFWHAIPRFSHHLEHSLGTIFDGDDVHDSTDARANAELRIPLKEELAAITSGAVPQHQENKEDKNSSSPSSINDRDAVFDTISRYFMAKLHRILQIPAEKIERTKAIADMGFDSLMAVDVRSWFLKELGIDVPVFRLLGGISVDELCFEVTGKFVA